jgi:ABC-type multidrug transport system fused ATPase/permease subunit
MEPAKLGSATDPRSLYELGRAAAVRDVAREDQTIRLVGTIRLVIAVAVVVLIVALVWASLSQVAWVGVGALALLFVVLVIVHQRASARRARAAAVQRFHERGIARFSGKWTEHTRDGASFRSPDHPYSGDLDVFGHASLFQLLNAAETTFGEKALADLLAHSSGTDDEAWREGLLARQTALRELSARLGFRERLSSVAHVLSDEKPDPTPFVEWAESSPPLAPSPFAIALSFVLPAITIGSMAFGSLVGLPRGSWVAFVLAELAFLAAHRGKVAPIIAAASSREGSLGRFGDVFQVIEGEVFEAPELRRLQGELRLGTMKVTREMAALARIVGFVDARQNEVFRAFIAPILLWDFHCAVALDRWRTRVGKRVRQWFAILGELEALASLAGLTFDRPEYAWPEPRKGAVFEGVAVGHPLLPATHRVDNDVELKGPENSLGNTPATSNPTSPPSRTQGSALVVTGSNMSGKSTLLRAVGLNAVLAMAGAPVCAKRLVVGRIWVATSMRVSDSLEAGVSHFLAELRTLKRVVDLAKESPPVLFLLDEILHGTNSRERLIGARAVVRSLTDLGAFGAVSTHDLGIAEPVPELEGRVKNVHFEEQVDASGTMTFDYRLRDGVVHSSNALRLMRAVGLDVPPDLLPPGSSSG